MRWGGGAAPLSEPDVWRSVVLATPRTGRAPPAVEIVARELTRQVHAALRRGDWPAARPHTPAPSGKDI
ncbi:hypothetical protein Acsp04_45840 [Actinomadura sp. NBRC 104425]|uniref:hypothetical protein n=1 Tax=Actinomadura sp. NBRC 104425 TaxID=3032204 RepID=UPI0024A0C13C|nr:hypothetical protein [Actinomadura sp. NBRC 104425]GLZ14349.1 hypothetical protein Acsp04_45840 [Actinomadura sp. NBRC 104425]